MKSYGGTWRRRTHRRTFPRINQHGRGIHNWPVGLKLLAPLFAVSIICVSLLYAAKGNHRSTRTTPSSQAPSNSESLKSFQASIQTGPPRFDKIVEGKYIEEREDYRFVYTIDPILQESVKEAFHNHPPFFGAFVAMEPATGKILALVDYDRQGSQPEYLWQRATYPAASIFKLVTAAAALEKGLLNYDSAVSFQGNLYRLGPQKLFRSSKRERQTYFDEALGKSNNVVFGRVASNLVGAATLRQYSEAFGFNHPIQFDFPVDMSRAFIPEGSYELARCGAGFGEVTLNPLHAAMIAATIANRGAMLKPYLIEEICNQNGEKLYQAKTEVWTKPITPKTARDLTRMMLRTVEDGTASRIFHLYGKNLMKKMPICGKTGSLSGDNPRGLYDWFVGFAPADNPQIAFAAMMINQESWRIKGAFVAQAALKKFFREQTN